VKVNKQEKREGEWYVTKRVGRATEGFLERSREGRIKIRRNRRNRTKLDRNKKKDQEHNKKTS